MYHLKYFGTDGIRGKVGQIPITPSFLLKLGWAVGKVLSRYGNNKCYPIIIGKDTRISGYMLEAALKSGLVSAGLSTASLIDPMPSPAISYLTRVFKSEVGIVISASHNPFYDNGVKFFSIDGTKLDSELEYEIEVELEKKLICMTSKELGKISHIIDAAGRYIEFCKSTFPSNLSLSKLKIVVDCANGATYRIAPNILRELGAKVIAIACCPNGININQRCGATNIKQLRFHVLSKKADVGIAYDGDGDRIIMVDHVGNKINGDHMLYIIARDKLYKKKLIGGIVGTLMSNMGLAMALKKLSIPFERARIGDRFVLSMLQKKGWYIGGESSGHIVLLDKTNTGDGIIVGLQILSIMVDHCVSLYELCRDIFLFPQIVINVYCTDNNSLLKSNLVKQEAKLIEKELSSLSIGGRMLLRKSGTESCIRIMLEGRPRSKISYLAKRLVSVIRSEMKFVR